MVGVDQARAVGTGNDFYTAVVHCGRVQGGPDGDERVFVQVRPSILVPLEVVAFACGFVHEHGAEAGDWCICSMGKGANVFEGSVLQVGQEEWVEFKVLDLAVVEGGTFVSFALRAWSILTFDHVELHEHSS